MIGICQIVNLTCCKYSLILALLNKPFFWSLMSVFRKLNNHDHTHGVTDPALITTKQGIRAVKWSFVDCF